MRVIFDISGTRIEQAGTTAYTLELLLALRKMAPENEYIELCYEPRFSRRSRLLRAYDTLRREVQWTQWKIPSLIQENKADLLHVPSVIAPFRINTPLVITVFDLHTYLRPDDYKPWQRLSANWYLTRIIKKADRILTISSYVRDSLLEAFPALSSAKVIATPLGVSERFHVLDKAAVAPVEERYSLHKPFILTVSTLSPNKNTYRLIKAYNLIRDRIDHDLVLVGAEGWRQKSVEAFAAESGIRDRVRYLGYLPIEDLPAVYNLADVLAFPSLYEGFGLPALEAMACGTPVVTSNTTSIPEVVGDAAVTVAPNSVEEIADGLLQVIQNQELKKRLSEAGLKRARMFTWGKCASKTLEVYNSVLSD